MQLGTDNNTSFRRDNNLKKSQEQPGSKRSNIAPGIKNILKHGRLSEEDLEFLRLDILATHKKKHYRVLTIAAILLILAGLLFYYLFF